MDFVTLIGSFAGVCTAISSVPQLVQAVRTRRTTDVSLMMYVVLSTGLLAWVAYGVLTADWPIIIANSFSALVALAILVLKLRHIS